MTAATTCRRATASLLLAASIAVLGEIAPASSSSDATSAVGRAEGRRPSTWATNLSDGPPLYDDTVVHDLRLTFADDDWLSLLGCERGPGPGAPSPSDEDVPAVLELDGETLPEVGVRCKGNSSLSIGNTKKPLNITTDAFVAGQRLRGFDVLNLDNGWGDPSQVRAALALRFLAEYMPAPRFSFARVTVQGRYIGLYTMSEQVNGEFAEHWFPDDDGYVVKGDSPTRIAFDTSTLQFLGESLAPYRSGYEAKGAVAQSDQPYVAVRDLTRGLDASVGQGGLDDAAFPDGIRDRLDVESALWYIASSNLIANFDSYYVGKNYFLYMGGRDPRFHVIPWDLGLSFGSFGLQATGGRPGPGANDPARVSPFVQETQRNRPLIRRLLAVPAFRADYVAHYRAMLDGAFSRDWVDGFGTQYQARIADAVREEERVQRRIAGSYTYAQFEANLRSPVAGGIGGSGSTPGILDLVDARRAYLSGLPELEAPDKTLEDVRIAPDAPTAADDVEVRASLGGADAVDSVELRYRVDGGVERHVAMRADGDSFLGTIPAARYGSLVTFVLRVGLADGRAAFFPAQTLTRPYAYEVAGVSLPQAETGDLVINELMADNETTIADEAGEFDDWLELYNRGDGAVDLAGYFLSDRDDDPWAYALPDQSLPAGGRLLIWCDNDPEQGPDHADFALSRDGESVLLSTSEETVQTLVFGPLGADESLMMLPDGSGAWSVCNTATPRQANTCDAGGWRTPETPMPTAAATTATPEATHTPGGATPTQSPSRTIEPTAEVSATPTLGTPTPEITPASPTPEGPTPTSGWQRPVYIPAAYRQAR